MNVAEALVTLLEADTGVTNLVGSRIWPQRLQQNPTMPAITYLMVTAPREYSHEGDSGLVNPRVQINCWANDYDTAISVSGAVADAVHAITYPAVFAGSKVGAIFVDSVRDDVDPDRGLQRRIVDLRIWSAG